MMEQMLSEVEFLRHREETDARVSTAGSWASPTEGIAPVRKPRCNECLAALTLSDGKAQLTTLLHVSPVGLRLDGVPDDWQVGHSVRFYLGLGAAQIPMRGCIVWRRDDFVRIHFTNRSPEHDRKIQWLLRETRAVWQETAFVE